MTLNEFINKRLFELKMNRSDLVNKFDINWSTLSCITQGKNVGTITKEKLARGLQCTIGDINSILAQQPHPLRKDVKAKPHKESVMETVDKLEQIVKEEHPEDFLASDPEDEAPEVDMMFPVEEEEEPMPVYHSPYTDMKNEGRHEYIAELKDLLVEVMAQVRIGEDLSADMFADFGKAVIDKLNEELNE